MESNLNEEERLEIASNPATKPEVLSTLSTDESILVRHCIGSNPSTSNKVLEELASDSSAFVRGAVAENSTASVKILSQLLGDACHFVENKAEETLRAIARNTETKTVTLEVLSKFVDPREGKANAYPWVRCAVAENPSTPQKTLEEFLLSEDEKSYVALNSGAGAEILESLSHDENPIVRSRVASNPSSTHKILENLARDPDEEVRREVLTNEGASLEIIKKILSEIDDYEKEAFARRRNCSRELLTLLASESKPSIRNAVAENTNTPTELLKILSKDDELRVRNRVAGNPSSTREILDYLSRDAENVVRTSVGDNTSSGPATLESLSSDSNTLVRAAVGGNSSSSAAALRELSSDPYTSVRAAVASNTSADLAILIELAADPKSLVRLEVAGNSEASPEVLSKLSNDLKASIRESVSGNLNTNGECLSRLLRDKKASVRLEVARNPNLSAELQKELAVDTRATVRAEVAKNSQVSAEVLQILSRDLDKEVRLAVAQNSDVPNEILTTFLIDESHLLREAANTRLRSRFHLAQTGISSTSFLGKELLDFKRVTEFFDEAVFLNRNEVYHASVDILYELAEEGHLDSIIEVAYTFMGQEDFEVAQEVLDFFPDPNNPRILYLKALLQEKSTEFNYEAYLTAAEAGSANAALVLFERNFAGDRKVAKYWLTKAESIGHHNLQKYLEMWDFKPKQFVIATARDETGSLTGVSIFCHDTEELLEEPNSIGEAIQFCITSEGGFDFQEPYSEVFDPLFRVKIFPDSQRIVIAEDYHDYWFGDYPSDLDAAIEEVCRRDCDWDLVFEGDDSALEEESE